MWENINDHRILNLIVAYYHPSSTHVMPRALAQRKPDLESFQLSYSNEECYGTSETLWLRPFNRSQTQSVVGLLEANRTS